jgi:hypothetical protein
MNDDEEFWTHSDEDEDQGWNADRGDRSDSQDDPDEEEEVEFW